MKKTQTKPKHHDVEEIVEQIQKLLTDRGIKALEMARNEILQEEIECREVREAINYFMIKYWHDTARPALISLTCEAVGGDPEIAVPIAAGITLISGATDIHDDIIDQSRIKESRPTVLGKFGEEVALLVGDALLFKGFSLLYKGIETGIPLETMASIIKVVKEMFFEMGDAEALELKFRGRVDVSLEEYIQVVRKKAADVESCTRLSAILGGGSKRQIDALGKYGRLLGMVFILRDDLTDVIDLEELQNRLKKECLPYPILLALQTPRTSGKINEILSKKVVTEKDAETLFDIVNKAGSLQQLRKTIKAIGEKAKSEIKHIDINRRYLEMLVDAVTLPLDTLPPDSYRL